jgi:uncharacterized protein (TIGR02186 family)
MMIDRPCLISGFLIIIFSCFTGVSLRAQEILTIDLAEDHVDITTGFDGANLVLYGTKDRAGDVAIVVRGPERSITVRKKSAVAGMWVNREWINFRDVPVYYDYALSRPETEISKSPVLVREGIGLSGMKFIPSGVKDDDERIGSFHEGLIRNKQKEGLFPLYPKKIEFLNDNFFKTTLYVPSNVPKGRYEIETFLFQDGRVVDSSITTLKVGQIGMSASLYDLAYNHSFAYGLTCIFIAAFAGWLINFIRNK